MSQILNKTKLILDDIKKSGYAINGTSEKTNVTFKFNIGDLNLAEEEIAIKKYYNDFLGENFTARMKVEQDHYLFLEYAMKHKISEIQYFHKDQDITSRKFIVFSGDCINCIHLLCRPKQNTMTIFMRSSDVLRLLPIDIFSTIRIMNNVLSRHGIQQTTNDEVIFWITSAHFYDRDIALSKKI